MTAPPGSGGVDLPRRVQVRDVGPRDGLQGERPLDPSRRAELAGALASAGVSDIEVASFVSPRAVPSMAGAAEVVAEASTRFATAGRDVTLWALVPNVKGAELAAAAGVDHLTLTVSASDAYSAKNTHRSIAESMDEVERIRATAAGAELDIVVSCCFGSPFADETITPDHVAAIVGRARRAGVDAITLADTTGMASPRRIGAVLDVVGTDVGLHLHDTRGTALVNAWSAIERGVTRFDTALGGLGGSPFAPAAGGNLATEDLVLLLDDVGVETGIDLSGLLAAGSMLADLVGHALPSRVASAGPIAPAAAT